MTFERRVSLLDLCALALVSAACLVAPWLLVGLDPDDWLAYLPPWFPPGAMFGWVMVGAALSAVGPACLVLFLRRRRGAVRADGAGLAFEVALGPVVRVELSAIAARVDTRAGVIARVPSRGAVSEWLAPLLAPATDDAARARAYELLDAGEVPPRAEQPPRSVKPLLVLLLGIGLPMLFNTLLFWICRQTYTELGVTLPVLTELTLRSIPTLGAATLAVLAFAVWGGTRVARQVIATSLAVTAWLAVTAYALVLPLITLNRPL